MDDRCRSADGRGRLPPLPHTRQWTLICAEDDGEGGGDGREEEEKMR